MVSNIAAVENGSVAAIVNLGAGYDTRAYRLPALAKKFYERMVIKENIWHFGFDSAEVADFIGEYGWRLIEDLSYEELNNRYDKPIGRHLPSMKIERMGWAEKI